MFKTDVQKLRNALEFTRIYKENTNDIYLRHWMKISRTIWTLLRALSGASLL